jgi:hypothetical protein
MEKLKGQNTFSGGLITDSPVYQTSNEVYTYSENITFITHKGNEMILQNEQGNIYTTSLKDNYIPLANKSYGQICYIISAEVINDEFTGRGEVGTFPSPDYNSSVIRDPNCLQCVYDTVLTNVYRPLMNYGGDGNFPINPTPYTPNHGEFNSINFNFKATNPMKICSLQPSYDGTVNVIFTDWDNKPRLINSRFTVRPNDKVEIIDRRGTGDDNLYNENSFQNKLNQIITSNKLVTVIYNGTGIGKLSGGNYTYYFKYYTQDGNLTNIIAESFTCSVFHGTTVRTTRGGVANEPTSKSNKLVLTNLDTSFTQLKVFFTYSSGEASSEPETTAFELENVYSYKGTSFEFTHNGFENTQVADINELNIDFSTVDSYRTCCEGQGRFFAGNIKNKIYDYDSLRIFSSKVTPSHGTSLLPITGLDSDNKHESLDNLIGSSLVTGTDGYDSGYYNPYNIHNRLGYWAGETYMLGIQYYFNDGSTSPVFPIRGIDNKNNNATYTNDDLFTDIINPNNDFENISGIYRPPIRNIIGFEDNQRAINLFLKFNIPTPPKEVLDTTIGFRIMRVKKRKQDCISQGILFNSMIIPLNEYSIPFVNSWGATRTKSSDEVAKLGGKLWDYDNEGIGSLGFAESNSKFIPAFDFMVDSSTTYRTLGYNEGIGGRSNESASTGIEMGRFDGNSFLNLNKGKDFISNNINKRFVFISPDTIANSIKYSAKFDNNNKTISIIGDLDFIYAIPTKNEHSQISDKRGFFSLMKNTKVNTLPSLNLIGTTSWVLYNNPLAVGDGKFSSKCLFQASMAVGHNNSSDTSKFENQRAYLYASLVFNSYVGVKLQDNYVIRPFDVTLPNYDNTEAGYMLNSKAIDDEYNNLTEGRTVELKSAAKLINIYREGGLTTTLDWFKIHIPEYETYIPITQPIYWNSDIVLREEANLLESTVLNGEVQAYNGDNFIQLTHRRIAFNGEDGLIEDGQTWRDCNPGYSITFLSESNSNLASKDIEVVDVNEGTRSFTPYYTKNSLSISNQDTKGGGNKWREYRLPESDATNTGFQNIGSSKEQRALSDNIPFIQNNFDTRIIYSDLYVQSGFQNGYRRFQPLNKEDYPKNNGQIVEIVNYQGNQILVVYEYGIDLLGINERYGIQGDGTALASAIYFNSIGVLPAPQNTNTISDVYGSRWQFSILSSDNHIYGIDIDKAKIWRFTGQQLELISDYKIQKFLREIKDIYNNKPESFLGHQVRTYYDVLKNNMNFTFLKRDICGQHRVRLPPACPELSYDNNTIQITGGNAEVDKLVDKLCGNGKQVIFNESSNQFVTFTNWTPQNMFTIQDKLYSFNIENNTNKMYQHYLGNDYSIYYDKQRNTVIEFVVTSSTQLHQIFENFFIIQNHVYPKFIEYWTENDYYIQTIKPRNVVKTGSEGYEQSPVTRLRNYDSVYKEDHMYISIMKDVDDTRTNLRYVNRRIRDKFCKVRFTYNTLTKLQIQVIITTIQQSFS